MSTRGVADQVLSLAIPPAEVVDPPHGQQKKSHDGHQLSEAGQGIHPGGEHDGLGEGQLAFGCQQLNRHGEATIGTCLHRNLDRGDGGRGQLNHEFALRKAQFRRGQANPDGEFGRRVVPQAESNRAVTSSEREGGGRGSCDLATEGFGLLSDDVGVGETNLVGESLIGQHVEDASPHGRTLVTIGKHGGERIDAGAGEIEGLGGRGRSDRPTGRQPNCRWSTIHEPDARARESIVERHEFDLVRRTQRVGQRDREVGRHQRPVVGGEDQRTTRQRFAGVGEFAPQHLDLGQHVLSREVGITRWGVRRQGESRRECAVGDHGVDEPATRQFDLDLAGGIGESDAAEVSHLGCRRSDENRSEAEVADELCSGGRQRARLDPGRSVRA